MAKKNEKAISAFKSKVGEIHDRLELLRWYADNMERDQEEVNWGHVGSADHIVNQLNELIEFLGITKFSEK